MFSFLTMLQESAFAFFWLLLFYTVRVKKIVKQPSEGKRIKQIQNVLDKNIVLLLY